MARTRSRKQDWDPPFPITKFREKVGALAAAAHELLKEWDKLDSDMSVAMARDYPFDKDYSEMVMAIDQWNTTIRKLE